MYIDKALCGAGGFEGVLERLRTALGDGAAGPSPEQVLAQVLRPMRELPQPSAPAPATEATAVPERDAPTLRATALAAALRDLVRFVDQAAAKEGTRGANEGASADARSGSGTTGGNSSAACDSGKPLIDQCFAGESGANYAASKTRDWEVELPRMRESHRPLEVQQNVARNPELELLRSREVELQRMREVVMQQLIARNQELELQLKVHNMAQRALRVAEVDGARWCASSSRLAPATPSSHVNMRAFVRSVPCAIRYSFDADSKVSTWLIEETDVQQDYASR
jgi:hypothetical protein